MKFCILVVHDLTYNISYDAKLNRSKTGNFWGKVVKILWKKREKWENICSIHNFGSIDINFCTVVVHISTLRYKLLDQAEWVHKLVILG